MRENYVEAEIDIEVDEYPMAKFYPDEISISTGRRSDGDLASNQQDLILRTAQAYLDVPGATDAVDSAKAGVAIETGRLPFGALYKFGRAGCRTRSA